MKFYIVTPSFNQINWLKLCIASVADQATGCAPFSDMFKQSSDAGQLIVHHHVQDGGSTDGTNKFLCEYEKKLEDLRSSHGLNRYFFLFESSPDSGMYDAINRGWNCADATVDVFAYLNCDEQYLPGTLKFVNDIFQNDRDVDMVIGSVLLVNPCGKLISYRKAYTPRSIYIISDHLYLHSCAMFWRKRIFNDSVPFDAFFKTIGDMDFVLRVLKAGYKIITVNRYLAVFTFTGTNLSSGKKPIEELKLIQQKVPKWLRITFPFLPYIRRIEKLLCGAYFQKYPVEYSIYTKDSVCFRQNFAFKSASFLWIPHTE